jgi:hypothetical protein
MIRDRIRQFESDMPSHAVRSLRCYFPRILALPSLSSLARALLAGLGGLAAVVLAISLTAFVAIEQFPLGDMWHELTVQHAIGLSSSSGALVPSIGAELPTVRLVGRPRSGAVSSGPTPLGLAAEGRAEGAVVIVTGLVPGMQLSAGDCAFFRSPANRRAEPSALRQRSKVLVAPPVCTRV